MTDALRGADALFVASDAHLVASDAHLVASDALLVVDVQNDFCAGGALAVPEGDEVVPVLNEWIGRARRAGAAVVITRDWHPAGHCSFASRGGPWPDHCVQGTRGAELHPALRCPDDAIRIDKAADPDRDTYSGFLDTGLAERLRSLGVRRVWIGGLALDHCVRATALDALAEGFEVRLLRPATRAVNVRPGDGRRAAAEIRAAGGTIVHDPAPALDEGSSALLTDLYQLTMLQAYHDEGLEEEAVFDLFVRRLPPHRNYLVACGLEDALHYLERLRFDEPALEYLDSLGRFTPSFLDRLAEFRFEGEVRAVPEGTPVFPDEPLLEVVAPLPQAQLVETFLLNQVSFQTTVASKAARVVTAAAGRPVVEFGLRRLHGTDAGLKAARACAVAGFSGTSNVLAGRAYDLPLAGTMAHSFVEAHDSEMDAFRAFAATYPDSILLVDTYDTAQGVRNVIRLAEELGDAFAVRAVRLDSGDLDALARETRRLLDDAGLAGVEIFASGSLDEHRVEALVRCGAPVDGFGVGTRLGTSADYPYVDSAYKMVGYAGRPRMKLSADKVNLPGRKQVYRVTRGDTVQHDVIALADETVQGDPLLVPVMRGGRRVPEHREGLDRSAARARSEIARLPASLRALAPAEPAYPVHVSPGLAAETGRLRRALATVD